MKNISKLDKLETNNIIIMTKVINILCALDFISIPETK